MIGVQSYGLSEALLRSPEETLKKLSSIGFDFLEPMLVLQQSQGQADICYAPYDRFERLWALTQSLPLRIECIHVSPFVEGNLRAPVLPVREFTDHLRKLHQRFSITEFVVSSKFSDENNAVFWGKYLREASKFLSDLPCRILYHNHDSEIQPVRINGESVPLMDLFVDSSHSEVLLELDIGWSGMVTDEVEIAKRYADLIYILHFKDFVPGSRGRFTCETSMSECYAPSGTGEIQTAEVLHLRNSFPHFCGKGIIEQNASVGDIFKDLKIGYQTIRRMLECTSYIRK